VRLGQFKFFAPLILATAVGLTGCGGGTVSPLELDLATTTVGEPGDYVSIAWFDDEHLAFGADTNLIPTLRIVVLDLRSGEVNALPVEPRAGCVENFHNIATTLAPGRLGASDVCVWPDRAATADLIEFDLQSGAPTQLASLDTHPAAVAWSGELGEGVFSYGSRICQGLGRIRDGRDEPIDLVVTIGDRQFNLRDDIWTRCETSGRADYPAYAPDGERWAFLASPGPGGAADPGGGPPWAIVIVEVDGTSRTILDGIREPGGLAWAADGSTLIFAGSYGGSSGVWATPTTGDRLWRLTPERPDWLAVSPDRRRLAGIVTDVFESLTPETHIFTLDLPDFAELDAAVGNR
jgi:hypothetical protein